MDELGKNAILCDDDDYDERSVRNVDESLFRFTLLIQGLSSIFFYCVLA